MLTYNAAHFIPFHRSPLWGPVSFIMPTSDGQNSKVLAYVFVHHLNLPSLDCSERQKRICFESIQASSFNDVLRQGLLSRCEEDAGLNFRLAWLARSTRWYASIFDTPSSYCACRHDGGEEVSLLEVNLAVDPIQ
jgi:hypothetical protein